MHHRRNIGGGDASAFGKQLLYLFIGFNSLKPIIIARDGIVA